MKTAHVVLFGFLGLSAAPAGAADGASSADVARLQADVTRLQQELREQKQLILNLMQTDQQRYDLLIQLLRANGGPTAALPAMPAAPAVSPAAAQPAAEGEAPATGGGAGTISGRVTMPDGAGEAYVYVEGLRGGTGRGRLVEIKQKDKQFSPRVVAVPIGTRLVFPNQDTVFHNVFSKSPTASFDLGSVKGGERSQPVALTKAGHLEIFCNIHGKMRADVLVVPNGYFARVGDDGTFQLPGIPAGPRRVVLWGPGIKPAVQRVDVTAKGATMAFSAQKEPPKAHMNKFGQVYGSYDE